MVGMFRTLGPGDSISVALKKLLQGGRRGSQATCKFATKAAGTLNIKDQVSNQGIWHSVYGKMQAPRLTYFICISAIWGESCFLAQLASCIPKLLSHHLRGGSSCRIAVWGALIHIWRPEIAVGCDISSLLIWPEVFSFHRKFSYA